MKLWIKIFGLSLLCFFCLNMFTFGAETVKIALFIARSEGDMFYGPFVDFMQEAVNDLGMELQIYYADDNYLTMRKQVKEAVAGDNKADVLVFQNYRTQGPYFMKIAEEAQVPAFLVNTGFQPEDDMGVPREKYKYWIGEMLPDDEGAGFTLANLLIEQAMPAPDGKIYMVGIEGHAADGASIERVKGLKRALEQTQKVVMKQIIPGNWIPELAQEKFVGLKTIRYPEISVVWTASDGMASGVVAGAKQLGLTPGKDILTGGVDWAAEGLEGVQSGEMVATIGGHFMEGGWVAVLLYDYFNGVDFATESTQMRSKMSAITIANIETYLEKLAQENWHKIDFTKFSKTFHPEIEKYSFGLEALLEQL